MRITVYKSRIKKQQGFTPAVFWFLQYNYFCDDIQSFSGYFQQVYARRKFSSGSNFIKAGTFVRINTGSEYLRTVHPE